MHTIIFIVIFGFIIFIYEISHANLLDYQYYDLIVKLFAGIGAILTAWGVYWKWNDEKTRKLYERRLQEVYAPLCGLVIKQEAYRYLVKNTDSDLIDKHSSPIFSVEQTITAITHNNTGTTVKKDSKYPDEFPNIYSYFELINKLNMGLARPHLLILLEQARLFQKVYNDNFIQKLPADVSERHTKILCNLVEEIVNGYNDCISHLDLDVQKVNLDELSFCNDR